MHTPTAGAAGNAGYGGGVAGAGRAVGGPVCVQEGCMISYWLSFSTQTHAGNKQTTGQECVLSLNNCCVSHACSQCTHKKLTPGCPPRPARSVPAACPHQNHPSLMLPAPPSHVLLVHAKEWQQQSVLSWAEREFGRWGACPGRQGVCSGLLVRALGCLAARPCLRLCGRAS